MIIKVRNKKTTEVQCHDIATYTLNTDALSLVTTEGICAAYSLEYWEIIAPFYLADIRSEKTVKFEMKDFNEPFGKRIWLEPIPGNSYVAAYDKKPSPHANNDTFFELVNGDQRVRFEQGNQSNRTYLTVLTDIQDTLNLLINSIQGC